MKRIIVFCFLYKLLKVYAKNEEMIHLMAQKHNSQDNRILGLLLENYDQRIRPVAPNGTGPVTVKVNIMMRMLSKIDVVNMVCFFH